MESVLSYLDGGVGEDPCDNLRKGEYTIVVCFCMCQYSGEGVNHLLIHCKVAYQLWCFVFFWHLLGIAKECERYFVWLAELVWKKFVGYLEYGSP